MKLNSLQDLKCLKPKEVLEEEEKQERRRTLIIKAQKVANNICNLVKGYYRRMTAYNEYEKSLTGFRVNKPEKPKLKELETVFNYVERHGLEYTDSKNTENDDVFYASELTKALHKRQSKYIGESLSSFRTFIKKFI